MKKLNKEVNKIEIYTSSTKKVIVLYERLKNDVNGNPSYQVTLIPQEGNVQVYNCISYTIEESIIVFIGNEYNEV